MAAYEVGFAFTAQIDRYTVAQSTSLDVAAPGVLGNDGSHDGPHDGPALAASLVTPPQNGTVTLNADGSFNYQPNNGFVGIDSFVYRAIANGDAMSNSASVVVEVTEAATANRFVPFTQWASQYGDGQDWKSHESHWKTIQFPNINGDGKDDICGRSTTGIFCAEANLSGTSFGVPAHRDDYFSNQGGWHSDPSYYRTIQFPDFWDDGRADVCGRGQGGINCGLSTGSGFGPVTNWRNNFTDAEGWADDPSHYQKILFPDVTGDGYADVCGRAPDGIYCAINIAADDASLSTGNVVSASAVADTVNSDASAIAGDAVISESELEQGEQSDISAPESGLHDVIFLPMIQR